MAIPSFVVHMNIHQRMVVLMVVLSGMTLPAQTGSPMPNESVATSGAATSNASARPTRTYNRPSQTTKLNNYFFDAIGPYAIVSVAAESGIGQWDNAPPEWSQGAAGYGRRFGSDYGISAVSTTTRYALSETFKEDPLYYRCDCAGVLPRLRYAAISVFTARRGADGRRVFSLPALVGPYAGSMVAVYGWYPNRFGAKDAFRIGNYSLLEYGAENISLEFIRVSRHSFITRMHFDNRHGSPSPGTMQ